MRRVATKLDSRSMQLMITAAVNKSFPVANPSQWRRSRISFQARGIPVRDQWHHGHTRFKSAKTQSELWKDQRGSNKDGCPVSVNTQVQAPVMKECGMADYLP